MKPTETDRTGQWLKEATGRPCLADRLFTKWVSDGPKNWMFLRWSSDHGRHVIKAGRYYGE